ncbi:MAG: hypothetical protein KDK01_03715 [Rhodobacteraceae bacterium]|nr:hypothetical protein [Paracoccaceae bacterium]
MGVKRDNEYYEKRLKAEHPTIHADWKAGAYSSLRAACVSIGLMKKRTRLTEMLNTFDKATATEKSEFLDHLRRLGHCVGSTSGGSIGASLSAALVAAPPSGALGISCHGRMTLPFVVAIDGILTAPARSRIIELFKHFGWINPMGGYQTAPLMRELGAPYKPYNASLGMALQRGTRISEDLEKAIEGWLITIIGV